MDNKPEVEQLKEQEDVKTALKQTAGTKEAAPKPVPEWKDKLWFVTYIVVMLGLGALHYLVGSSFFQIDAQSISLLRRLLIGAILLVLVGLLTKSVRVYLINQIGSKPARYNLTRVLHLLTFLIVVIIGLSVLSTTWYTALVSLGLLSLILGFALQTPITSLIGWVYLLIRQPYKVGDRIQIGEARGDVIDVSYLDTTLWEFGGPYLSTQHPSGRIIKFPNSLVLSETVYNYSWPLFPYVWNEIKFQVAYDSDLDFIT
ncbi:MAG: mechanosensitive ion channel family protein, partial [Chloroflexi bacterium]